ncbi:MAG: preprotein translocase subunit SecA [Chloroflexi bacterium]|nr:preprotein translocase subunit SecA [Chloroflexota bacterium]
MDALDAYFDTLRDAEAPPRPQKMLEEINSLVGLQIRLSGEQLRLLDEDPPGAKKFIGDQVRKQLIDLYTSRVLVSAANRVGETLGDKLDCKTWDDAADRIHDLAVKAFERKREYLVGENGQIARDIQTLMPSSWNDNDKLQLLIGLSQGAKTTFNQKTHRQERQVFQRFSYIFLAARLLEGMEAEELTDAVLTHLEQAEDALVYAIGQSEYARIASNAIRLADFGEAARKAFGEERLNETAAGLGESDREALIESLGRYALNESHRRLLLSATSELWVDYLTRIEALRISIGLEAYAQRDPLVQYKSKASEMFPQLVEDIRGLVVSRIFTMQRKPVEITPIETADLPRQTPPTDMQNASGKKKRRRRS